MDELYGIAESGKLQARQHEESKYPFIAKIEKQEIIRYISLIL